MSLAGIEEYDYPWQCLRNAMFVKVRSVDML